MRPLGFLVFGIFLCAGDTPAAIRVVSDIDDTAKIANVGSTWPSVANAFFSSRSFAGMPELYQSMARVRHYEFEYLSAAPEVLTPQVHRFLETNAYPPGSITLKSNFSFNANHSYKVGALKRILDSHPEDSFILVGDDTQSDVEAYDELYRFAPHRILAIYIRKVVNQRLPPAIFPFLTAFEIARTEYLMGRMSIEEVEPVAMAVLGEPRENFVFPRFAYCPIRNPLSLNEEQIEQWNREIEERTETICKRRSLASE